MKTKGMTHIGGTLRAWKAKKRRELRAVEAAIETLNFGAAFFPSGAIASLYDVRSGLRHMREEMSAAKWGR